MSRINVSELTDEELAELLYEIAEELEARLKYRTQPAEYDDLPF